MPGSGDRERRASSWGRIRFIRTRTEFSLPPSSGSRAEICARKPDGTKRRKRSRSADKMRHSPGTRRRPAPSTTMRRVASSKHGCCRGFAPRVSTNSPQCGQSIRCHYHVRWVAVAGLRPCANGTRIKLRASRRRRSRCAGGSCGRAGRCALPRRRKGPHIRCRIGPSAHRPRSALPG